MVGADKAAVRIYYVASQPFILDMCCIGSARSSTSSPPPAEQPHGAKRRGDWYVAVMTAHDTTRHDGWLDFAVGGFALATGGAPSGRQSSPTTK
jgi:hypothetical protein